MFSAVIIACHLIHAEMCMKVSDQRGPYETEKECQERLGEMTLDLVNMWGRFGAAIVIKKLNCDHIEGIDT